MQRLAARIRMHRAEHRIPQDTFADQLGVSRQSISFWENAHVAPNAKTIRKLAAILNVPVEKVLEELE
jgi:DNA-binding XRE family transcriptional regulator